MLEVIFNEITALWSAISLFIVTILEGQPSQRREPIKGAVSFLFWALIVYNVGDIIYINYTVFFKT